MYYVNDKQFKDKCTAREYSWQLCREFSKEVSTWKIVRIKSTREDCKSSPMIDSYGVYDIESREMVYEAHIIMD